MKRKVFHTPIRLRCYLDVTLCDVEKLGSTCEVNFSYITKIVHNVATQALVYCMNFAKHNDLSFHLNSTKFEVLMLCEVSVFMKTSNLKPLPTQLTDS